VRIRIGPIPFRYRNTEGRRRLAPAHDLHHVLTGYDTSLVGEGEAGCFEIGTGMRDATGLWLSLRVVGFTVVRAPRRLFRAFVRGRRSGHLLGRAIDEALLDRSVADVRRELRVPDGPVAWRLADAAAFLGWATAGVTIVWGAALLGAALAWAVLV
jgi:hypothetical protein